MRHRGQRGMTLVELLIAMAVTAVVLVGLTGTLFTATTWYQYWADRLDDASTGAALASALQQDSERYPPCQTSRTSVSFCLAGSETPAVTYTLSPSGGSYAIYRQSVPGGPVILMARGATNATYFTSDCFPAGGTLSGHVHVYQFRSDMRSIENFSVYYHAPPGPNGNCP
jgi:prepilin-type N-terminal cleavage/methylation domain-containing protein